MDTQHTGDPSIWYYLCEGRWSEKQIIATQCNKCNKVFPLGFEGWVWISEEPSCNPFV